jgi:hypothetical protein
VTKNIPIAKIMHTFLFMVIFPRPQIEYGLGNDFYSIDFIYQIAFSTSGFIFSYGINKMGLEDKKPHLSLEKWGPLLFHRHSFAKG